MEEQQFFVKGGTYSAADPRLQQALARIYDSPERPRCMCVHGGIDMYVAKHRFYVVKRMPETGSQHNPMCPSYEPESQQSGLGELVGDAVINRSPELVELRVDFPFSRVPGRTARSGGPAESSDVSPSRHKMSLRAVMHFLLERAGLNRWYPSMEGKRNQGVLHKYLSEVAEEVTTKGLRLSERFYVPEPFSEATKSESAERRRRKLAVLQSSANAPQVQMALVFGEFKGSEAAATGRRIWIKHMPDAPLLVDSKTWTRIERAYARMFEALDADTVHRPRLAICALIYAKREHTYQVDTASFMLATEQWIPIEGVHELDLIRALVEGKRRFVKPLRYDAKSAAPFPNALLLDVTDKPVPLHITSGFMNEKERAMKEKALKSAGQAQWVWQTDQPMPVLPPVASAASRNRP